MEASKEEWVNSEKQRLNDFIANTALTLVVLGVNPLFLEGLHIYKIIINRLYVYQLFILYEGLRGR